MFTAVKWSQFQDSIGNSCQAQGFLWTVNSNTIPNSKENNIDA